jgi:hypothetical protein
MTVLDRLQRYGPLPGGKTGAAQQLHARVAESFTPLVRAWSNRDADSMRPYASREYVRKARETFDALDAGLKAIHTADDALCHILVERPRSSMRSEPVYAYAAIVARTWLEDLRTGETLGGLATTLHAFTQRWTFVFEPPRGWVTDSVDVVWAAAGDRSLASEWHGVPAGWYSRGDRPLTWTRWTGTRWVEGRARGVKAGA